MKNTWVTAWFSPPFTALLLVLSLRGRRAGWRGSFQGWQHDNGPMMHIKIPVYCPIQMVHHTQMAVEKTISFKAGAHLVAPSARRTTYHRNKCAISAFFWSMAHNNLCFIYYNICFTFASLDFFPFIHFLQQPLYQVAVVEQSCTFYSLTGQHGLTVTFITFLFIHIHNVYVIIFFF